MLFLERLFLPSSTFFLNAKCGTRNGWEEWTKESFWWLQLQSLLVRTIVPHCMDINDLCPVDGDFFSHGSIPSFPRYLNFHFCLLSLVYWQWEPPLSQQVSIKASFSIAFRSLPFHLAHFSFKEERNYFLTQSKEEKVLAVACPSFKAKPRA